MQMKIGTDDLEDRDLTLIRSTMKLRPRAWGWADTFAEADLWLVDLTREQWHTPPDKLDDPRVACLDQTLELTSAGLQILTKPLKAGRLNRLFDSIETRVSGATRIAPQAAPDAPAAPRAPWAGKHIRLLKSPNLAKYPVSVELLDWVETMRQHPVDVDLLDRTMPLDRDMLRDLLNDAAKGGYLVDDGGGRIAPMAPSGSRFKLW